MKAQRTEFDRDARRDIVHDVVRQGTEIMNVAPSVMGRFGFTIISHPWLHNFQTFDSAGYGVPSEEWVFQWTERDNPA